MIVENIEDNDLLNIEIDDEIGTDKEIIGTFVKNTAKLSIRNLNHQYDNLKDKYISISNFGSWYVYDLINNEDATEAQLSLYDISNKFDEEYNVELYSFPCTFGEWATKIGEVVGVPLEGTFLNYNLEIKEAPFLGTNPSNRDAVKFIAKYASGYAQINSNDTYSIKWFDKTIYEIEDWESFAHGNESKEVNTVVLSTGDTGDNECWPQSKPEDHHEIKIVDDWTNIDRTTIIEDIYNQLRGFKYTPITKLEVPYGLLELRAGQMIKAQDIELKYITTYISGHKLTWDGGDFDDSNSWSSSIKMMEISETSSKYTYSGSVINRLIRTERTVDKQNQIIKDVVESTDEAVSKVNEFEMSLDGIKLSVDETNKKFDKEIVTKKNAIGNPIEVDDAGEYPLESIAIDGENYQKTTTGRNLFPTLLEGTVVKGDITFTHHDEDDSYDIVGTATTTNYLSQIALRMTINDSKIENGKYYTMSLNQAIPKDDMIVVAELYGSSGYLRGIVNSNYPCMQANLSNATAINFYIYVKPGKTVNIKGLKVQVEEGTVATAIEPYTGGIPSPNSKYPQGIKTVQGVTNYYNPKTDIELDGQYRYYGGGDVRNNSDYYGLKIRVEPNTNYTVSSDISFNIISNVCFFDSKFEYISGQASPLNIKTPSNCYWITIALHKSYTWFQLEKGTIAHRPVPAGRWLEQITYSKNNAIFDESYKSNSYTYNSFDADNISVVKNATGGIFYARYKLDIREAGDYIISSESNINHQIYVYRDALWGSLVKWVYTGGESEITFEEAGTYILGVFANSSTAGAEFQIQNLMVRKKTIEDSSYAKYKMNSALIDMNKSNEFDGELELGNLNNGSDLNATNTYRSKNYLKIKPNTVYSFYLNKKLHRSIINFYDKDKKFLNSSNYGLETKGIFTSLANAEYMRFRCYGDDKLLFENAIIEIYEGYDPYYEFAEVEDTRDSFIDGTFINKIGKHIFTGDETIVAVENSRFNITIPNVAPGSANHANVISNYYAGEYAVKDNVIFSGMAGNQVCVVDPNYTTLASFKEHLKKLFNNGNPLIAYYILKELQIYELPYEHLKLHKGYNYITLNDDLYPNMEIEYLTDSVLNATYATHAELKIESDKISSEVAKKVSSNDLNEVIEDVNSTIEQKAESITSEINGKFANYSTTSQMNASIKSQVNEKGASIIDQVNGKFTNYSTTTEMNSKIEKKIDDNNAIIKLEVSKVDEKVDNIQVGVTNLVHDSAREITVPLGTGIQSNRISVTPGETLAISFDVKGASAYHNNIALIEQFVNGTTTTRHSYTWIPGDVKTTYSRIKYLYTVPKDIYSIDFGYRSSSNVLNTFKDVQIERGNMFTDWDAAPEDKLDTAKFTKAEIIAEINEGISNVKIYAENIKLEGTVTANGTFVIDKDGSMKATAGIIGGWEIFEDHLSADTIIGNNLYRTYLQPVLKDHEKDTWVFSIQKGAKGAVNLNSIFNVLSNGDISTIGNIKIASSEKVNVFISLFNPSRGGDARFAMSPTGNYGIYDAAFSNWREYFSNDGSSNKWILPAFDDVSLDYFFTSENLFMFRPSKNGSTHLGGSKWRWIQLWAVNATSTSSDENDKRDMLEFIDKDDAFFDKLKPISFYRKKGDRRHFGFGAQSVEKALQEVGYTSQDFAGLCFDTKTKTVKNEEGKEVEVPILDENGNEELSYSLRYEEFISLNTWQIQKAKERISNLEDIVKSQQETIENLIKRIEKLEKIEEGGSN